MTTSRTYAFPYAPGVVVAPGARGKVQGGVAELLHDPVAVVAIGILAVPVTAQHNAS